MGFHTFKIKYAQEFLNAGVYEGRSGCNQFKRSSFLELRIRMADFLKGTVVRMIVDSQGVSVLLDPKPFPNPDAAGNFPNAAVAHANYTSIYTLLMASAVNKKPITLYVNEIANDKKGDIIYVDYYF